MKYKMNEFDYIEKYFKPLTNEIGRDLKNDAAIFNQKSGCDLIAFLKNDFASFDLPILFNKVP